MDCGQNPIALAQQAVENQQGQRRLFRVGVDDNVTESTEVLVTGGEDKEVGGELKQTVLQHGSTTAQPIQLEPTGQ